MATSDPANSEFHLIRLSDLASSPEGISLARFEGKPYGVAVSFSIVENEPGIGSDLHDHPYAEIFVIHAGRCLITAGSQELEIGPQEIAVVGPGTPHRFVNLGPGRLKVLSVSTRVVGWLLVGCKYSPPKRAERPGNRSGGTILRPRCG